MSRLILVFVIALFTSISTAGNADLHGTWVQRPELGSGDDPEFLLLVEWARSAEEVTK